MAKRKPNDRATEPAPPDPAATPRGRGRPKSSNPKPVTPIILSVRGRDEYLAWYDGLADALRKSIGGGPIDRVGVFDRAVGDLARALGYPEPPDRY